MTERAHQDNAKAHPRGPQLRFSRLRPQPARAACYANARETTCFALTGDSCPLCIRHVRADRPDPGPGTQPIVGLSTNNGCYHAADEATAVTVNATAASTSFGLYATGSRTIDGTTEQSPW